MFSTFEFVIFFFDQVEAKSGNFLPNLNFIDKKLVGMDNAGCGRRRNFKDGTSQRLAIYAPLLDLNNFHFSRRPPFANSLKYHLQ